MLKPWLTTKHYLLNAGTSTVSAEHDPHIERRTTALR